MGVRWGVPYGLFRNTCTCFSLWQQYSFYRSKWRKQAIKYGKNNSPHGEVSFQPMYYQVTGKSVFCICSLITIIFMSACKYLNIFRLKDKLIGCKQPLDNCFSLFIREFNSYHLQYHRSVLTLQMISCMTGSLTYLYIIMQIRLHWLLCFFFFIFSNHKQVMVTDNYFRVDVIYIIFCLLYFCLFNKCVIWSKCVSFH